MKSCQNMDTSIDAFCSPEPKESPIDENDLSIIDIVKYRNNSKMRATKRKSERKYNNRKRKHKSSASKSTVSKKRKKIRRKKTENIERRRRKKTEHKYGPIILSSKEDTTRYYEDGKCYKKEKVVSQEFVRRSSVLHEKEALEKKNLSKELVSCYRELKLLNAQKTNDMNEYKVYKMELEKQLEEKTHYIAQMESEISVLKASLLDLESKCTQGLLSGNNQTMSIDDELKNMNAETLLHVLTTSYQELERRKAFGKYEHLTKTAT
eukprot:TRINITY_DN5684_c0_g1_i1.p1 TRINITY_DN5684_c0_g1~~TRINITY_DN5684_c0_g1_i1.p1  ORF type:complete len:265 (-),score=50.70 TRINITY_DN5684_c0_g1_i1:347-1141(-)